MLSHSPQTVVIIPALNEEASIGAVVAGVGEHAVPLVVDDGSTDNTGSVATEAGARVVRNEIPGGYDAALNRGFAEASKDFAYAVTLDADGQHDPQLLVPFVEALQNGCRLIIGQRPRPARLAEAIFGLYTRLRYGVRDPLCGMKGYDMALYRELGHFDSYQSIGTELMLYGLRRGVAFQTIPVPIHPREGEDAPRFGRIWQANLRIARAMLCDVTGRTR